MNKESLIEVFNDTIQRIENYEYNPDLQSFKLKLKKIKEADVIYSFNTCNVTVVNEDCIEVARKLSNKGKTCVLNMASSKRPGGGVRNGSMAQEEELARRSNLVYGLPYEYYPLDTDEYIYTKDVTFFKDKYYNITSGFDCDVITMAAVNLNRGHIDSPINVTPKDYEQIMYQKIDNMLFSPQLYGCHNLVLSAFGCGVFKNDPNFVASLFNKIIEKHSSSYDTICFAILNDRNSVGSNFEVFKNILT